MRTALLLVLSTPYKRKLVKARHYATNTPTMHPSAALTLSL